MMDLGIARKVVGSSTLRKESEGNPSRTAAFKTPEQNAQIESLDRQRNPCRLHSGSRPGDNSVPARDDSHPAESTLTDLGPKAILPACLMPSPGMVALGHHT